MNLKASVVLFAAIFAAGWLLPRRQCGVGGGSCGFLPPASVWAGEAMPALGEAASLQRGKAIVTQAAALLSSNLTQAIAGSGISNALSFCSVAALPLTGLVASSNQVELRRVSHKTRNPKDRAAADEVRLIDRYQTQWNAGVKPLVPLLVTNAAGGVTFYSPIVITNALCLNCHGSPGVDIQPANLEVIRRLYPSDEATGFKLGDLRGLWRVEFGKPAP